MRYHFDAQLALNWLLICLLFACIYYVATRPAHTPEIGASAPLAFNRSMTGMIQPLLKKSVMSNDATSGYVIVYDYRDQSIIASLECSHSSSSVSCGTNAGLAMKEWEPGSVMKPLLVATALDIGAITPSTRLADKAVQTFNGRNIVNALDNTPKSYGLYDVLSESRNTGAVEIFRRFDGQNITPRAKQIWRDNLRSMYDIGKDGVGHIPSLNADDQSDYRYALSSFGIGMTAAPLQVMRAYGAIGNDGIACGLDKNIAGLSNGCTRIMRSHTSYTVDALLQKTGRHAYKLNQHSECGISGKSGTAPIAQSDGTYLPGKDSGVFIGNIISATASYVVMTRLDEPDLPIASTGAREVWNEIAIALCKD